MQDLLMFLYRTDYEVEIIRLITGAFVTVVAACSDLDNKKVDNRLILGGFMAGAFYMIWYRSGFLIFLLGAIVPVLLLWLLFLRRILGAGDIKVLMVIGWIDGVNALIVCMLSTFAWSAVMGICLLIRNRIILKKHEFTTMPFAVAIFMGYVSWMIWSSV